jgi:hypothetical protein
MKTDNTYSRRAWREGAGYSPLPGNEAGWGWGQTRKRSPEEGDSQRGWGRAGAERSGRARRPIYEAGVAEVRRGRRRPRAAGEGGWVGGGEGSPAGAVAAAQPGGGGAAKPGGTRVSVVVCVSRVVEERFFKSVRECPGRCSELAVAICRKYCKTIWPNLENDPAQKGKLPEAP